tara:strand:- start:9153 stop:9668 length:516 start_codon:yes stop_codon:yes gene_type:complete
MIEWFFEYFLKKKNYEKINNDSDSDISSLSVSNINNDFPTILKPEQYNVLWGTSWMTLFSSMYAIKKQQYLLSLVPFSVFLTSLNYWRLPLNNWRKDLDVNLVRAVFIYQTHLALKTKNKNLYLGFTGLGVGSYILGKYFFYQGNYWNSTYCHIGLHLFANIGNVFLYDCY